jgi:hypothetical protein
MPKKPKTEEKNYLGITSKLAKIAGFDVEVLKKEENGLELGTRKILETESIPQEKKNDKEEIKRWVDFIRCLNRLFIATKTNNPASLGKAIGIKSASVYPAIKKHEIPDGWFITVGKKFGVSIDWLVGNDGSINPSKENISQEGTFDEMLKVIGEKNPDLHDKLVGEIARNFNKS